MCDGVPGIGHAHARRPGETHRKRAVSRRLRRALPATTDRIHPPKVTANSWRRAWAADDKDAPGGGIAR